MLRESNEKIRQAKNIDQLDEYHAKGVLKILIIFFFMKINIMLWNINKIILKDFLSYHEQTILEQDYHLARQDLEETFDHIDF